MSQSTKPQKPALPLRSDEKQVAPALKAWLDNVIVPALVKEWLAERHSGAVSDEQSTEQQQQQG
jgi:hypothetical protein